MKAIRLIGLATLSLLAGGLSCAHADDYYKGKTIRLIVGTPPGGGYDAYGRLVGRHLPDFIPGRPNVVVSNLPGASGTKAAMYLQQIAPKDGTVIATFNKSMPLYQALGQVEIGFKTEEMSWLGNMSQSADVVAVWHKSAVRTIEDAKRREVVMGADSGGGTMTAYPALLNSMLGTKFRVVTGYPGSNAVNLAMERGEVEGRGSTPWSSLRATRPAWIKDGLVRALVQVGFKRDPDLPDVPLLIDLAQTEEQRLMFRLVSAPVAIERPFAGPPGMAAEPLAILRRAFDALVKDPAVLAEAERQNMDMDPHTGEEVAKIVAEIIATPPAIVKKVKEITAVKETDGRKSAVERE